MFPVISVVSAGIPWRAGVAWLALSLSMQGVAQILEQEMADLGSRVRVAESDRSGLSGSSAEEVGE
jgi:hypothetical protein